VKVHSPQGHFVVKLANGHSPFDTRIFIKEAAALVDAGYTVSLIIPHHENLVRDGVTLIAVPPRMKGFGKLVVNPWNIFWKALKQPTQAVFHIHDSDILFVGILLKLLGRKVIYDAHEDTPLQIQYQHWVPKFLRKPYGFIYYLIEKVCGWMFDAIIVAEPVIAKYFPPHKTYLVRNFSSIVAFRDFSNVIPYATRDNLMVYVGLLSEPRGLFEMLEGAKVAHQHNQFKFLMGGKFSPPSLEKRVIGIYDVDFLGWVQFENLPEILYKCRIGIIIPQPNPRYKTNYPVKLFEYMAAAIPVIASREGESAAFVNEAQCGILVDPFNTQEIADAIAWLLTYPAEAEAMGKRGQQLVFGKYNWENEKQVLLNVYQKVLD
jgi:glycosyltransferase involved in cell wall biosynthesis